MEQEQEVKRSEEYLSLKEKLDEYEQEQVKNNISEREKVGVAGIQKSYNKYIATEKAKITEKAKSSSDLESKLSKQNAALKIASDTKDLQGAYKVLKTIELDLIEDLDDETRAKKLEDIKNTNQKITEEQLNALAEANQEKLELTKKGIDEEVALHEQYVKIGRASCRERVYGLV